MPVFLFLRSGVVTLFGLNVGDTAIVSTPSGVDWAFPLNQPHFLPPRFASPRGVSKRRLGSWNECQEDEVNYADSLLLSVVVLSSFVHSYRCTLPPHAHMQALVPKLDLPFLQMYPSAYCSPRCQRTRSGNRLPPKSCSMLYDDAPFSLAQQTSRHDHGLQRCRFAAIASQVNERASRQARVRWCLAITSFRTTCPQ